MFCRFGPLNPQLRLALALWATLAVALCAKTIRQERLYRPTSQMDVRHTVYSVFAAGSRHWWRDQSLYASYAQTEGLDDFRYSPAFAVAFTPLAVLPHWCGAAAWGLLSIAALVWSLRVFFRDVLLSFPPTFEDKRKSEGVFLSLALAVSVVGIWSGQSNAAMLAMILLGLSAIARRRWWPAACWLAVPVFIKLWPALLVLILVCFWPRQLIGRLAVACTALTLLPFLTRPPSVVLWQYHEWCSALTGPLLDRWSGYRDAWTVWEHAAAALRLNANAAIHRHVYVLIQLASAAAMFFWCVRQRRRNRSNERLLASVFSMWAAWQLLFGPGVEQLTYGLIAPTAAWAVMTSFAEKKWRCWTVAAWALLTLLPSGDIEQFFVRAISPAAEMLLPLGIAMLAAWLAWHERGEPPATPS